MGIFGHCAVGLAAKPLGPKVPLGVLFLAAMTLDVLAIAFGFAGFESGAKGIPWSSHTRVSPGGLGNGASATRPATAFRWLAESGTRLVGARLHSVV
jgi:hypothetical protein